MVSVFILFKFLASTSSCCPHRLSSSCAHFYKCRQTCIEAAWLFSYAYRKRINNWHRGFVPRDVIKTQIHKSIVILFISCQNAGNSIDQQFLVLQIHLDSRTKWSREEEKKLKQVHSIFVCIIIHCWTG